MRKHSVALVVARQARERAERVDAMEWAHARRTMVRVKAKRAAQFVATFAECGYDEPPPPRLTLNRRDRAVLVAVPGGQSEYEAARLAILRCAPDPTRKLY